MFIKCVCLLFVVLTYVTAVHETTEHDVMRRAITTPSPSSRVIIDTAKQLHGQFIALYVLFPLCLMECCICLPIVLGLTLGICATVPGCRIHKSLTKKVREEYILEQEANMPSASIFPPTTIYPGNMTMELPPYEEAFAK
eukprot:TRINITY_DN1366_c0_g3_i1.p1 TRINITY_DN1366_c0_g3~~TRINITY_DN1366_c0_g3_i1.p1  ORF type:complete len:140 (+),score=31.61 TRINITY_DN1366_c0_g3_i1:384-803(+)